jgi:glyoxylase-like metal-dependent hydrolase (beta-lactamase superfamily II)
MFTEVELAAGVFRLALAWSNCYLLSEPGRSDVWLIDCGLSRDRTDLLNALARMEIDPNRVSHVLLTHAHCDHAGNAGLFERDFGARVAVHPQELRYIASPRTGYGAAGWRIFAKPVQSAVFRAAERMYPVQRCLTPIEATDELLATAPGGALRPIHTPGHTSGRSAEMQYSR